MNTLSYKTISAKKETVARKWYIVDLEGKTLGRAATEIARVLRGKHKTNYTPHVDTGDYVVVINADKFYLTGRKMTAKQYVRHTGYPGGQRFSSPVEMLEKHPERIIESAVRGMLPKTKLGRQMFRKLFVYNDATHPHIAQKPEVLDI
ncbi:MAG: 50S ribosomal protein L13 [Chitinophagales bacterium]|nr:50S ribosomal protein L13 [Bacteroidota bacterium]